MCAIKASVVITGMGHGHPPHSLDNQFFTELGIGTSAAWIEERTGILNRFSVLSRASISALKEGQLSLTDLRAQGGFADIASMAKAPWKMAAQRACQDQMKPQLVLCGTSLPDSFIPAQASLIAQYLGIDATAFDAHSACSSFVTNLAVAKALIETGGFENAAIFNVERYTLAMDFRDRRSCILFGDGAAATLLEKGSQKPGFKILDVLLHSDPAGCHEVAIPVSGYFQQNGARVQKFAVTKTCEVTREILERNQLQTHDISYFIGHQANLRMLTSVCQRLGLDARQHLFNVHSHGNQGAAGAPIVLSSHWESFKAGELIVLAVVGSGLTWGAALLEKQ